MKKILLAAGLALSCVSCASVSSSSERILGAPVFPPTTPQSVVIYGRKIIAVAIRFRGERETD